MTPRHRNRLLLVSAGLAGLILAVSLILNAFRDNLVFFHTPSEILADRVPGDRQLRLGGLVEDGSVHREDDGVTVHFRVTDTLRAVDVTYEGILPNLFREGQGVVVVGQLDGERRVRASQVMARHDETYMPPEAAESIKQAQREAARTPSEPDRRLN